MASEDTQFKSGNKPPQDRPKRGAGKKRLMLEAIRKEYKTEEEFLRQVARQAIDESNPTLLGHILSRIDPPLKPSAATVSIDFTECSTKADKAEAIMNAVARGDVPPDIGQMLIGSIKQVMEIEVGSDLIERLEGLERNLLKRLEEISE